MDEREKFGFTDRGARIVFRLLEDASRENVAVSAELEALLRRRYWSICINDQPPVECAGLPPVALAERLLMLSEWRCAPCRSYFLAATDHVFFFDRTYNRRLHDEEVEFDE